MSRLRCWFVLWALFSAPGAAAAELWFGPYLQDVHGDGATVMWTTRGDPGRGQVRYSAGTAQGETPSAYRELPPSQTKLASSLFLHRAELRGLTPGTEYNYSVSIDGVDVAPQRTRRFRTPRVGQPIRFLVMGDSGDESA